MVNKAQFDLGSRTRDKGAGSPDQTSTLPNSGQVQAALSILTALFVLRVVLQPLVLLTGDGWLPPFDAWDSETFTYPQLLVFQAVYFTCMTTGILVAGGGPRPKLGSFLTGLGLVYGAVMVVRAAIGFLDLSDHSWFGPALSTPVHLVAASYLIILGSHLRGSGATAVLQRIARVALYPALMVYGAYVFAWSLSGDLAVPFSAYFSATLACGILLAFECVVPYRADWQPTAKDISTDITYMVLVQLLLPAVLTGLIALVSAGAISGVAAIWPSHWPVAIQVALMVLAADFGRYWMHRLSHAVPAFWRLHAVHHAPESLHALNVGRFHAVEKALQFGLDALPFILLGTPETVIGGYLVFYAVNGFFQHSNLDVRLGPLNWIVSGPELHRWHHARDPKLSDHNFGNNLIVWDVLFGTRLLPGKRHVEDLGLLNRSYPDGFAAQFVAPVRDNPSRPN